MSGKTNALEPGPLLPVATGRELRRYLRAVAAAHWRRLLALVAVMVCASVTGLAGPVAIGWITEAVVTRRGTAALVLPIGTLAAAAVLGAVTVWASGVLLARFVLPQVARLREGVLSSSLSLPIDTVEAGGVGDLVARISGDVERVSEAAQGALGSFVSAALTILLTLAGLAAVDWRFLLAGLLAMPIQTHTLRWYLRTSGPVYGGGRRAEGRRAGVLLGTFGALTTVRALRLGPRQLRQAEESSADAMEYEFRATRLLTRFFGRLNLAEFVGLGGILLVAFFVVDARLVTVGAATTAALFFAGLFNPINTVLGVFDELQQAGAGLARLLGVASAAPEVHGTGVADPGGAVVAQGVGFGYGAAPDILHEVSFDIEPGRQLAIVGTTGSGKSSLASLSAGIRRPRRGRVALGGSELASLDPRELRRAIALVTQETHVFAGSIIDNLRLGLPSASVDAVTAALAEVDALRWVEALPRGIETGVGAGGHPLTAGQAQHLALARLLLLDPGVVVLDEATAEAGSDSSRVLDRAARRVLSGRTALVVAHRLSQTAAADAVLVLEGGVVVERGTHDSLLASGGAYATLWAAWSQQAPSD